MSKLQKLKRFLHNFRNLNGLETELTRTNSQLAALQAEYTALRTHAEDLEQRLTENYEFLMRKHQELCDRLSQTAAASQEALESQHQAITRELEARYTELEQAYRYGLAQQQEACEATVFEKIAKVRCSLKKQAGLPIRVVFLCELASLWNSFHTVVTAMQADPQFEVILVRLWYKEYSSDGSYQYRSSDFSKPAADVGQEFIDSYDPASGKWLDLEALQPDYVFYMRPYDYYRHEDYHIEIVSKYTKTCYIPYGMSIIGGDVEKFVLEPNFSTRLHFFFLDDFHRADYVRNLLNLTPYYFQKHFPYLGYPRMDLLQQHFSGHPHDEGHPFTILWLPRWNTQENCCTFFEYKDILPNYAMSQPNCKLIFRPHPLCFQNFLDTGELSSEELDAMKNTYTTESALALDESGDYLPAFQDADVLVADETTLIAEYYVTGKPIIFCKKETHFSNLMQAISPGLYIVENPEDLQRTLNSLRNGIDPLRETRRNLIETDLIPNKVPAGIQIKDRIAQDFHSDDFAPLSAH